MLIDRMGGVAAGVVERVVDPGIEVVSARLSDPATGILGKLLESDSKMVLVGI